MIKRVRVVVAITSIFTMLSFSVTQAEEVAVLQPLSASDLVDLLQGPGFEIDESSVTFFGNVQVFNSLSVGEGYELEQGIYASSGGAGSEDWEARNNADLGAISSWAPGSEEADIADLMNSLLDPSDSPGVTNFSAVSFSVTSSNPSLSFDFLFASNEPVMQGAFDIAIIAVDGVNYAYIKGEGGAQVPLRVSIAQQLENFNDSTWTNENIFINRSTMKKTIVAQLDPNKSTFEIVIAVADTFDRLYPSFLFVGNLATSRLQVEGIFTQEEIVALIEEQLALETPSHQLKLVTSPILSQSGNSMSCSPGTYKFLNGGSTEEAQNLGALVYTLVIDGKPVSRLGAGSYASLPSHFFPAFAQTVQGTADMKGATWDVSALKNFDARCEVYAWQSGGNIQSTSEQISDLVKAAEIAAKAKAWEDQRASATAANFTQQAREMRKRIAARSGN